MGGGTSLPYLPNDYWLYEVFAVFEHQVFVGPDVEAVMVASRCAGNMRAFLAWSVLLWFGFINIKLVNCFGPGQLKVGFVGYIWFGLRAIISWLHRLF